MANKISICPHCNNYMFHIDAPLMNILQCLNHDKFFTKYSCDGKLDISPYISFYDIRILIDVISKCAKHYIKQEFTYRGQEYVYFYNLSSTSVRDSGLNNILFYTGNLESIRPLKPRIRKYLIEEFALPLEDTICETTNFIKCVEEGLIRHTGIWKSEYLKSIENKYYEILKSYENMSLAKYIECIGGDLS